MKTSNLAPHQSAPKCASALPFKEIPATTPAALVDPDVTPEDLMFEFEIRIWGRVQEVFHQKRVVPMWKGASPSIAYRSLAASDIAAQLEHLLRIVQVVMHGHTAEVDPPKSPKNAPTFASEILAALKLPADFKNERQNTKMPNLDE